MSDRCNAQPHSLPMPYTERTHWWKLHWQDYEEYREGHFNVATREDRGYMVGDVVYMQYTVDGGYAGRMYRQVVNVEQRGVSARGELVRLTLVPVDGRDVMPQERHGR